MEDVLARGPNFVYAREFINSEYGTGTWEALLAAMPEEPREVWTGKLLVTGVYPFSAFKQMLVALSRVVGELPATQTASMYEFIADRSLTTIHKFFFRFADPSFAIKRYPILWKRFFAAGEVRVPKAVQGKAHLEFELPKIFLDWLFPACFGYSKKAVELAGGSHLEIDETSREELERGVWRIRYELRWRE